MSTSYRRALAARLTAARYSLGHLVGGLTQRLSRELRAPAAPPSPSEPTLTAAEWQNRVAALAERPLISIVMPMDKAPERWLRRAVASVQQQHYPHWELGIVADGAGNRELERVLAELSAADARVRVFKPPQDHRSAVAFNFNFAVAHSQGEFIAVVDPEDELTPDALYCVAAALAAAPATDIVYSDEDKIDAHGVLAEPFRKPDWSPELLLSHMYVGHLTVYRKTLIEQVGGFRPQYDFSPSYDLLLRAVETTSAIGHVPQVLYHRRKTEGSAARADQQLARKTDLAALQSALERRGIAADAHALPTANQVRFRRPAQPRVSLIIPSDSADNIAQSLTSIDQNTQYPELEIIVVTNSALVATLGSRFGGDARVRFHRFDQPFNFSQKCNEGVAVATGAIVVFFNDDVRPLRPSWLTALIEYLELPGVGAVAPKLLYEDGTIQHAGLVTGVRGLVGTAFHTLPADSPAYFSLAQTVRDVAALSGACLAMRRELFHELGGFDAQNFPINHSDVDLCFRVRERGLRCVYTPYATLLHIGHQSLQAFEKKQPKRQRDRADIALLQRWAGSTAVDPYYPEAMRRLLYSDSPGAIAIYGKDERRSYPLGVAALFVSHELSDSGAPLVLFNAVQAFVARGGFAVVLAPADGPFRERFAALGVPVICDSLVFSAPDSQCKLIASFDVVVANTMVCWPVLRAAAAVAVPVLWYLHESSSLAEWIAKVPGFYEALHAAEHLIVGSYRSLQHCRGVNSRAQLLPYGVAEFARPVPAPDKIIVSVFASVEPRKGQDLLVRAIQALDESVRQQAEFWIVGRPLQPSFAAQVQELAAALPGVRFMEPVSLERYQELLLASDIIVCPSRDDTLPLVSLDAWGAGKALVVSTATGTMDFMTHGRQGLVFASEDIAHLALCLQRLIAEPALRQRLGRAGRELFVQQFSLPSFHQRFVDHLLSVAHAQSLMPDSGRQEVAA